MNKKTQTEMVGIVRRFAASRRLLVANIGTSPRGLAIDLAGEGHRVVVFGDGFNGLYDLKKRCAKANLDDVLIVETGLEKLPVGRGRLDVVVLSDGLQFSPRRFLKEIHALLRTDGLLVWPHPPKASLASKLKKTVWFGGSDEPRPSECSDYTSLLMETGFREVGQAFVKTRTFAWTITSGLAGARPWIR